jgi:Holliday junction DNA helicase RuvA
MALNVLSIGSADDVRSAIADGNTAFIQKATGVGKRVAERIVVDLKDKVGLTATDLSLTGILTSESNRDEATEALLTLGFSTADAARALSSIDSKLSVEERVRLALKGG